MNQLLKMAFKQKASMILLIVSAFLKGFIIIGQAYFFVIVIDRAFLKGEAFDALVPSLAILAAILLTRAVITYLNGWIGAEMSARAKAELRESLFSRYSAIPVQAALKGQSGKKVSVIMDAVDGVDSYFSQYIPQMIQAAVIPIMLLVVVFSQHVYSGLIIVITAPFIPFFMIMIGIKTKKKSEEQLDKLAAFAGKFVDTLQGLITLKLYGKAKQQKEAIRTSSYQFRDTTMEVLRIAFVSSLMLEFISMLSIGLVALEIAIRLVVFQSLTFFTAFFILVLVPEFYSLLKEMGSAFHTGRTSMGAANKVLDELKIPARDVNWGHNRLPGQAPPEIELKSTSFQYEEDGFSLSDIQAVFEPYSQAAIIGRSGSGKTTLLHLIAGLIRPSEGEVIISGKGQSEWMEEDWFSKITYISQQPYLFSGTIADNIAITGTGIPSMERVKEAAEKAGLSELIQSLKDGYETRIGEAGRGLSGGEKQRIAVARAFYKNPSVVLFDEPTTGLDLRTEQIVQDAIHELAQGATIITVAHRLHTIKNADKILFLENGRLKGCGNHHELMEKVKEYQSMVNVQQGEETG
ncbi:thiol reductant ABC exporter subunit CydD [Sediminibacillus massiliensis]|uniref:thiol reductant ABC exporter subunit CydD n=1 Tax=Sediminibacillus massiliensis TaxID=1926277 RepID=UPI0009883F82|nr:thiol reductant ABC exporter subunit CydD [Sediminibacillus massiliensis]